MGRLALGCRLRRNSQVPPGQRDSPPNIPMSFGAIPGLSTLALKEDLKDAPQRINGGKNVQEGKDECRMAKGRRQNWFYFQMRFRGEILSQSGREKED